MIGTGALIVAIIQHRRRVEALCREVSLSDRLRWRLRGANIHAGFGDLADSILFRKSADVPQFRGLA